MRPLGIVLLALGLGACASTPSAKGPPGDPRVYAAIASNTDCAGLQDSFDLADQNHTLAIQAGNMRLAEMTLSYMQAADDRRRALGC
jgi:hypothetical protein